MPFQFDYTVAKRLGNLMDRLVVTTGVTRLVAVAPLFGGGFLVALGLALLLLGLLLHWRLLLWLLGGWLFAGAGIVELGRNRLLWLGLYGGGVEPRAVGSFDLSPSSGVGGLAVARLLREFLGGCSFSSRLQNEPPQRETTRPNHYDNCKQN